MRSKNPGERGSDAFVRRESSTRPVVASVRFDPKASADRVKAPLQTGSCKTKFIFLMSYSNDAHRICNRIYGHRCGGSNRISGRLRSAAPMSRSEMCAECAVTADADRFLRSHERRRAAWRRQPIALRDEARDAILVLARARAG